MTNKRSLSISIRTRAHPICRCLLQTTTSPTTHQPIIRWSKETGERELILARWGLVPSFTKDLKEIKGLSTINASAETIATSRTWREPLYSQRVRRWSDEHIEWVSAVKSDGYAEYYDQAFLARIGLDTLAVPLIEFWPAGGPRWDALAKADGGKIILVEAKAYIEEAVDGGSRATPVSVAKIAASPALTKAAFGSVSAASWERPFYQYANRLAHLHFLRESNGVDAYLVFLNFADAPDVPEPCSELEWEGADRLIRKCLGIRNHPYQANIATSPTRQRLQAVGFLMKSYRQL